MKIIKKHYIANKEGFIYITKYNIFEKLIMKINKRFIIYSLIAIGLIIFYVGVALFVVWMRGLK